MPERGRGQLLLVATVYTFSAGLIARIEIVLAGQDTDIPAGRWLGFPAGGSDPRPGFLLGLDVVECLAELSLHRVGVVGVADRALQLASPAS